MDEIIIRPDRYSTPRSIECDIDIDPDMIRGKKSSLVIEDSELPEGDCDTKPPVIRTNDHNKLSGIQGGTPDERYHLNRDDYGAASSNPVANSTNYFATMSDLENVEIKWAINNW